MTPPPIPMQPPPIPSRPKPKSNDLAKAAVAVLAAAMMFGVIGHFVGDSNKASSGKVAAPVETSDPCGWAKRPSGMTREACERLGAVQFQLWREEQLERDPNFKPYALKPNR